MIFSSIKVISFDLDDTLFDNRPIIQSAEDQSRLFLAEEFNRQGLTFDLSQLLVIRNQLIKENDLGLLDQDYFFDDLGLLRQLVLEVFCQPITNSSEIAQQAYQLFLDIRQQVTIEPFVLEMIKKLSSKFTLVSISNGNSDPNKMAIAKYLKRNYSPAMKLKAKPNPEMLQQVLNDFGITKQQLLHVGDSLQSDGQAAKNLACPFYHLSPFQIKDQQEIIIERFLRALS